MATWVQVDNDTWWWWSHVADLGPYTGTVPPSAAVWMPSTAAEIDFVIGRPHPSGDVRRFRDGSYDAGHFSGAYTFDAGGGVLSSGMYGDMTTLEPGVHLFVQVYSAGEPSVATSAPSVPPLGLVPAALISGGYGPTREGGHFSDWIEYGEVTEGISASLRQSQSVQLFQGSGRAYFLDVGACIENQRQAIQNYDPVTGVLPSANYDEAHVNRTTGLSVYGPTAAAGIYAQKIREPDGTPFANAWMPNFEASAWGWRGSTYSGFLPPVPPFLLDLVQGTDFDLIPGSTGQYVEYQNTHSTFVGWQDLPCALSVITNTYDAIYNATTFDHNATSGPAPIRKLQVYYGPAPAHVVGSDDLQTWYGPAPGTLLHEFEIDPNLHGWNADDNTHWDANWVEAVTLNLSEIPYEDFVLYIQTSYYGGTDHFPLTDFDPPADNDYSRRQNQVFQVVFHDSVGGGIGFNQPNATRRLPKFRYWIPGALKFHCPPGYTPRATTIEGHWSEWQPGYTVDSAHDSGTGTTFHHAPADIGFFAREDSADAVTSSIGIFDALTAAQVHAYSGGATFTDVPPCPSASGPIWNANFAHSALGYSAGGVVLPYYAYAIQPASAYLPYFRSLNQPAFFAGAVEDLQYAQIPADRWTDMRNPSPYDDREGQYYVDWERPVGTWHRWSTVQGFLGMRALYYYDHGDDADPGAWHGPDTIPIEIGTTFYIAGGSDNEFAPVLAPEPWLGIGVLDTVDVHLPNVYNDRDFQYEVHGSAAFNEDISGEGRQFTLIIRNGWISFPGHYPYITPDLGLIASSEAHFNSNIYPWPGGIWTTPRWRYWIPAVSSYECVGSGAVRLTQRNDGLGVSRHPRLNVGNAPSSQQANRAARVNRGNTYT